MLYLVEIIVLPRSPRRKLPPPTSLSGETQQTTRRELLREPRPRKFLSCQRRRRSPGLMERYIETGPQCARPGVKVGSRCRHL